ncbi:MAG TPA: CCP domain-containing protein [Ignavibacteriaceae bacterium]
MKDVKVEDISNPDKPILKFEHLDMNITNTSWKYPNAFTSNRFKKARLRIIDTKRYKWSFRFTAPTVKLFVRINFNFINYTFLTPEQKQNFTFFISLFVSPERKCVLEEQSDDKWREHGRKTDCDFTCDSISTDAYKRDIENPGDYMVMETQASHPLHHELIAVFFGKVYGTLDEPLCGEPEVSVSHLSRFNQQYKDYIIDCKSEKTWLYVSKQNDAIPETTIHGLKCKGDMIWNGSYPECIPLKPCPLDRLLIGPNSNQTVISSYDGLYFFNESIYYAHEGTQVHYGCVNPGLDILVGKETRVCFKNGSWSGAEPYCYGIKFDLILSNNQIFISFNS